MKKYVLALLLAFLALPFIGMASTNTPTPTFTSTPTITVTPIPQTPVATYIQQGGQSTASLRVRSAEYVYDVSVSGGGVGAHVLRPVVGSLGIPYGAIVLNAYEGATEKCFDNGGSSTISFGTLVVHDAFMPAVTPPNNCGTTDGNLIADLYPAVQRRGTSYSTGLNLLNDLPVAAWVNVKPITRGRMHIYIVYLLPIDRLTIEQATLTPSPTPVP